MPKNGNGKKTGAHACTTNQVALGKDVLLAVRCVVVKVQFGIHAENYRKAHVHSVGMAQKQQ